MVEKKTKPAKKKEKNEKEDVKLIFTTGKRKRAVARATVKPGSGRVSVNSVPLELIEPETLRMRLSEPLLLAGEGWKGYDIMVNVKGGGIMGQVNAARQAIARGIVEVLGDNVKRMFTEYDRTLLVYDPRRTEPHKPPRSSQGPRRYKQRSKR